MKLFDLIKRNLGYFRGVNAALLAGVIVATAVLTGALLVGDSVRGSLAQLTRDRLGKIDYAIFARRFFDASLADRLADDEKLKSRFTFAPAITLNGGASTEDGSVRAGSVQILAAGSDWVPVKPQNCILNVPTSNALGSSAPGKTILLSVPDKPDEPRDATLSRRAREDTLVTLRANVQEVHAERDMLSLFNPQGGQRVPQNAWVNLADLQDQIDVKGRVNALFAHDSSGSDGADLLNERLRTLIRLEDYGLSLTTVSDHATLSSRLTYIDPPAIAAAEQTGIPIDKISVNLINALSVDGTPRALHYVVAAGISTLSEKPLADDEIVINQWTADQLGAKVGDHIRFKFYERQLNGALVNKSSEDVGFTSGFRVAAIIPMTGIGADATLTPSYKGLTDSDTIAGWNPPEGVEIDKKLVTKADEDYWHRYHAAPKIFISFAASQKLWGGGIPNVTSIRIAAADADRFRAAMGLHLDPAAMGLAFLPIMAQQLAASSGNTDFGEYFIYFSFFIIFAAVMLVAMLFRLNVEQRAPPTRIARRHRVCTERSSPAHAGRRDDTCDSRCVYRHLRRARIHRAHHAGAAHMVDRCSRHDRIASSRRPPVSALWLLRKPADFVLRDPLVCLAHQPRPPRGADGRAVGAQSVAPKRPHHAMDWRRACDPCARDLRQCDSREVRGGRGIPRGRRDAPLRNALLARRKDAAASLRGSGLEPRPIGRSQRLAAYRPQRAVDRFDCVCVFYAGDSGGVQAGAAVGCG